MGVTAKKPASRARARVGAEERPAVDDIIREIVAKMTAGEWRTGISHADLAAKHGVTEHTVSGWATTASRLIRLAIGDGEEVRARLVVLLEDIHRRALDKQAATSEGALYDAPDLKAAVSAVAEQAKLLGLVEQKHKHEHAHIVANYEALAPQGKAQWLRERAQRMLAEADRLDALTKEEHLGQFEAAAAGQRDRSGDGRVAPALPAGSPGARAAEREAPGKG